MALYIVTEHHGRKIRQTLTINAVSPEDALRASAKFSKTLANTQAWRFIDDGMGGGALIDPRDEDHCMRADPRPDEYFQADTDIQGKEFE